MTEQPRLGSVLSKWRDLEFNQKPKLVKTFTAGLNHDTHLLSVGNKKVVLKLFSHSQKRAINAQKLAHSIGIAPAVLHVNNTENFALFEYLDSPTLTPNCVSESTIKSLANGLRILHDINNHPIEIDGFDILTICNPDLTNIAKRKPEILSLHQQIVPIIELFKNDTTPWVFCHNDLVAENCFIVKGKAQFIDWEYAQQHNPWFDIAAIVTYFKLSPEQSKILLESYCDNWGTKLNSTIFFSSQCSLLWGDMLWHLDKYGTNVWLDMDDKWRMLKQLAAKLDVQLSNVFTV